MAAQCQTISVSGELFPAPAAVYTGASIAVLGPDLYTQLVAEPGRGSGVRAGASVP